MNALTRKADWEEFVRMVGLTQSQTLEYVQQLVEASFVRKSGLGYSITKKGKITLKALHPVSKGMEFHFSTGIGKYVGLSAESLKDFYELAKKVDVASLEFHVSRGDFEKWTKDSLDDIIFAEEFKRIKKLELKGEILRNEIIKAIDARYNFEKSFSS